MKIILNDGTILEALVVTGSQIYAQGANRDSLTFVFPNVSVDEIDALFNESNCESIMLIGNDGEENIYKDYVIRTELVKKPVVVSHIDDIEEVTEVRVMITMAQRTYAEKKLIEIETQNMETAIAVAELGVMIAGGNE